MVGPGFHLHLHPTRPMFLPPEVACGSIGAPRFSRCFDSLGSVGSHMKLTHTKLANVEAAFRALPKTGRVESIRGHVAADGSYSHVQGLAVGSGHYLFIHSDENREGGRILIADRTSKEMTAWYAIPPFAIPPRKPFFHHAGGCQLFGEMLVVACETGQRDQARSVAAFFDVTEPTLPRELQSWRIENRSARAMAAGFTQIQSAGRDAFLVATFEHGQVEFYEFDSLDQPPKQPTFRLRVDEDEHQTFLLLTDQQNQVFAVGLNTGGLLGKAEAVLYRLKRGAGRGAEKLDIVATKEFETDEGARLRWGATIVVPSEERMILYCSSRRFDRDVDNSSDEHCCTLNIFDPATPRRPRPMGRKTVMPPARASRRRRRGAARRRLARRSR